MGGGLGRATIIGPRFSSEALERTPLTLRQNFLLEFPRREGRKERCGWWGERSSSAKVTAFLLGPPNSQSGLAVRSPMEGAGGTGQGDGGVLGPQEGGLPLLSQLLRRPFDNQGRRKCLWPFSLHSCHSPPSPLQQAGGVLGRSP